MSSAPSSALPRGAAPRSSLAREFLLEQVPLIAGALLAFAGKRGVFASALRAELPRVEELTFDAARRRMTTLHATDGRVWVATKGALEAIPDSLVDELVVWGTPEQCRAHIQRYFDNGVSTSSLAIMPLAPIDVGQAIRDLSPSAGR